MAEIASANEENARTARESYGRTNLWRKIVIDPSWALLLGVRPEYGRKGPRARIAAASRPRVRSGGEVAVHAWCLPCAGGTVKLTLIMIYFTKATTK